MLTSWMIWFCRMRRATLGFEDLVLVAQAGQRGSVRDACARARERSPAVPAGDVVDGTLVEAPFLVLGRIHRGDEDDRHLGGTRVILSWASTS